MKDTWIGSFKLKLVGYFLLLSLLPFAAAFWGFSIVAKRSEVSRVDARLQAGLRAVVAAYEDEVRTAEISAATLADDRAFQNALRIRHRATIVHGLRESPNIRVETPGGFTVGTKHLLAAERQAVVLSPYGVLGRVVASVPFDSRLLLQLRSRSGLEPTDHVVVVQNGRIVVGPGYLSGPIGSSGGRTTTISIAGDRFRAVVADTLDARPHATLAVLTPQAAIDAAAASVQRRLLVGLLASLLLVGLVAWIVGRSIVGTIGSLVGAANAIARGRLSERVSVRGRDELARLGHAFNAMADQLEARLEELEAERERLRDAISRFGEALAATHDPEQLMRVVAETAVEATGARGGMLVDSNGTFVQVGEIEGARRRIEVPLRAGHEDFGTLLLFGREFGPEETMNATSLAAHAVVALDNARLHRMVERQALVDGLTGVANRRACEDGLASEVSRADRFDTPLSVVLGDLDDFKRVNDEHGHPVGDSVLREFALVLQDSVREVDVAGRWGGEEFMLILPGTDGDGAVRLAERIRERLSEREILRPEGVPLTVTASFGVAEFESGTTPAALVAAADAALYTAKRLGKNRVERAAPSVARA